MLPALPMAMLLFAEPSVRLAVTAPAASPGVDETERVDAAQAVRHELETLDSIGVFLSPAALDPNCAESACLRRLVPDATHVVRAQLSAQDKDFDLRLDVIEIETGTTVATAAGACELCTAMEVQQMVSRTAARLRTPLSELQAQPALLVVEGHPPGASVAVDGLTLGTAPYQGEVQPGQHQLIVSLPEHESFTQTWLAQSGKTHHPQYGLDKLEASVAPNKAMRYAGWTGIGLGIAGVAAGIGVVAIHNRPQSSSCPGGMTDINGRCPRKFDTLGAGIGTMAGGVLAAGVGAILLGVDAKRRRARVSLSPRSVQLDLAF